MRRLLSILACLGLLACSSESARPRANVIWAQFDPQTNDIPTPTDIVRDVDAGHLALPITDDLPPAEQEFRAYLNGLDGFPTSTPATFHFTADIDRDTVSNDSILVWELADNAPPAPLEVEATWTAESHGYSFYPPGGWKIGTRYLIAVRGGENGVHGAKGETVTAAPAFTFLRDGKDLRDHTWALPGKTPAERQANAERLEGIRETLEPLFQQVVSAGWQREEIALLFSFTTSAHPELQFDPLSQAIPLPNDLIVDQDTGLISVPPDPKDDPIHARIKQTLNTLDGFSTSGPLAASTTAPVDASATAPENTRLFELADPPVEVTGLVRYLYNNNTDPESSQKNLFITLQSKNAQDPTGDAPFTVLKPKTTYFWVVTGLRGTNGAPVDAQPVGALLRLKGSLVKDGKSQVSGIADADANRLEPHRAKMEKALDYLEAHGLARSSILAAVPFTTLDVEGHTQALLKVPYAQNLPLQPVDFQLFGPSQNPLAHVDLAVEGHFVTYDMLDPTTTAFGAQGVQRPVGFTMTYPKASACNGKTPKLIVFGQALTTERRLAYFEDQRLAEECFAVFSFDLPYHGERSSCNATLPICSVANGLLATAYPDGGNSLALPDGGMDSPICTAGNQQDAQNALLCDSQQCGLDGKCVNGDFVRYPLYNLGLTVNPADATQADPLGFGAQALEPGNPMASGAAFINIEDLGATRDHFRQSEIDFSAAFRFATQADWSAMLGPNHPIDFTDVGYTGISLGGILGGVESGAQPKITTLALNVGGAGLVDLFQEPGIFGTILPAGLATQGIVINADYNKVNLPAVQFDTAAHWILDDVDPLNIARFALQQRDDYVDVMTGEVQHWPQKRVLVQMAGADFIVPNPSTYRLRSVLDPNCKPCDATDEACAKDQQCVFTIYSGASHIFEANPLENLNPSQLGSMTEGQDQVARFLSNYK